MLVCVFVSFFSAATTPPPPAACLTVRDGNSQQDVRFEAWGAHAIRVRAVPLGRSFRDDLVSALVPPAKGLRADGACPTTGLEATAADSRLTGPTLTNGNLVAAVGQDGRISFTRRSDGKLLLKEQTVRSLRPTSTAPPVPGVMSLDLAFEAVDGERIFGLGQHAKLAWDHTGSAKGQLDNKGLSG